MMKPVTKRDVARKRHERTGIGKSDRKRSARRRNEGVVRVQDLVDVSARTSAASDAQQR